MTRDPDKQIRRNLQAVLDAAADLLFEVQVPETGDDLAHADRLHQIAFAECIRRVGEAVAQIDSLDAAWLTTNLPGVPWQAMKSTRNRLTHRYWTADYQILHDIAVHHLPAVTGPIAGFLDAQDPYRLLDSNQNPHGSSKGNSAAGAAAASRTVRCQGRCKDGAQCRNHLLPGHTCGAHNWTAPDLAATACPQEPALP